MNKKRKLGQFFTTNTKHILQGFESLVKDKNVVDPFAGKCDLLNWAKENGAKSVIGFDIDNKCLSEIVTKNDSLESIPSVGDFSLTNPPYLAKNKMSKTAKSKLPDDIDDYYLLSMRRILEANPKEGIMIVPINFFSAENSNKVRIEFLSSYNIGRINYFTNQVFDDTTYNVVVFHYFKDESSSSKRQLNFNVYPENKQLSFEVEKQYNYRIGGKELNDILVAKKRISVKRITEDMLDTNSGKYRVDGYYNDYREECVEEYSVNKNLYDKLSNNFITFECIDGKGQDKLICANNMRSSKPRFLVGKNTSRNIASIIVDIPPNEQDQLIDMFNMALNELRAKYDSLFLTNFRDGNRKRISFDFCYKLLNYCYSEYCDRK